MQQLPAEWADFRGTTYDETGTAGGSKGSNNSVLSVKTPIDADESHTLLGRETRRWL
ncbi:MAG: hypothetical protein ACLS3C_00080 [Oscillospiraceae bacterium]